MACRDRSTCTAPGAAIRTAAYVVSACSTDLQGGASFAQKLVVRRRNCDPVTIVEFRSDPVPAGAEFCRLFGTRRNGLPSMRWGLIQRTGVLPDGSRVVFEITDEFSAYRSIMFAPPERGIFIVPADGSEHPRRLGDATHASPFTASSLNEVLFVVSPDGRKIAFSDFGPGADGPEALQVFTLDVADGARRQLTRLTARADPTDPQAAISQVTFADNRTIAFQAIAEPPRGRAAYTVHTDGTGFRRLPSTVPVPGAIIVPEFDVVGLGTYVAHVTFPGKPLDEAPFDPDHFREIFLFDHDHVLQLTNFHYFDTRFPVLGREQVFFQSSADPLGDNPGHICQAFSVNVLGANLRQLTHFQDHGGLPVGCNFISGGNCSLSGRTLVDPVARTVVFKASCDPHGTNPYGDQLFAMRPDGTGLRQLTALRGMETPPDGTVSVELVGQLAYSASL